MPRLSAVGATAIGVAALVSTAEIYNDHGREDDFNAACIAVCALVNAMDAAHLRAHWPSRRLHAADNTHHNERAVRDEHFRILNLIRQPTFWMSVWTQLGPRIVSKTAHAQIERIERAKAGNTARRVVRLAVYVCMRVADYMKSPVNIKSLNPDDGETALWSRSTVIGARIANSIIYESRWSENDAQHLSLYEDEDEAAPPAAPLPRVTNEQRASRAEFMHLVLTQK